MPRKTKKTTRRGNGEGGIYQRKDGRWCGQVLTGYNELGKPVRKTYYGATREEVARKVSATTNQIYCGTYFDETSAALTVDKLVSDFLWIFKKPTVCDVTFDWYLTIANKHVIPALGTISADKLMPHNVQALINNMYSEKHLSVKTIKVVRDVLNQTYKHALEMQLISTNPITATKLPKRSRVQEEASEDDKVIPVKTRTEILAAAETDLRMKTAITMLMFTGMRVGEWLALTWGQVDLENCFITIDRAITKTCEYTVDRYLKGRTTVVGDTKTQCSVRKIKVSQSVIDVLKEWRDTLPEDLRSVSSVVFPNNRGKMRSYNGFRTTYRRFLTENSLNSYSLHAYRHTFATMLLEQGVNPKVVQKLLGHRDIETTLGVYSHALPEVLENVAETIDTQYKEVYCNLLQMTR